METTFLENEKTSLPSSNQSKGKTYRAGRGRKGWGGEEEITQKEKDGALDYAVQLPLTLLRPLQDLPSLVGELGLAAVAGDVGKKDGLEGGAFLLALAGQFALGLLELNLDIRGLGELLVVDSLGDVRPEIEGLVGGLLLIGRQDLGRDVEGSVIDDEVLIVGWYIAL